MEELIQPEEGALTMKAQEVESLIRDLHVPIGEKRQRRLVILEYIDQVY